MPSMSKVSSDPPADLEKGRLKAAATEEDVGVVDPCMAMCIKTTVDVFVGAYTLVFIGMIAWLVKNSHNWWDQWQAFLIISAIVIWTYSVTPRFKDGLVRIFATKPTHASDCDASAKLLA
ncbi:unnamed protein product [Urochloa decumbens]|uniref:Uncharacterized protein n=1 Tax=Urochloa decumbens TaxID=240449 RepID=A0ABC9AUG5_9POAL